MLKLVLLYWSGLKLKFLGVYPGCYHGVNVTVLMEHPPILICGLKVTRAFYFGDRG